MKIKVAGYLLVGIGIIGIIVSLAADKLGLGKGGLSALQLFGAQLGVSMSLIGAALIIANNHQKIQLQKYALIFSEFMHNKIVIISLLSGFLVTYILFFIFPAVFNENLQFHYFDRYLPDATRVGLDIRMIIRYLKDWLTLGQFTDTNGFFIYPPLFSVIFAPLVLLGYPGYYFLITAISIASYFLLTLIIPGLIKPQKDFSLVLFFLFTGMFSYGWQFELERGQFNVIAFTLCLLAVYLFHYHEKYRHFAYLFFSISVQLKIYPLIFIVMFIKDWRDWKNNFLRMIGLCLFNFALLFVLGYSVFLDWIKSLSERLSFVAPSIVNHSIKAFVSLLAKDGFNLFQGSTLVWLRQYSELVIILLFGYFAICFLSILIISCLRNKPGLNGYLLLACTIGAMVIPDVSYDYKLAILAAPMSIAFNKLSIAQGTLKKSLSAVLIFIASVAYSITLCSFKYRPDFLANSMPLLFVILTVITILYLIKDDEVEKDIQEI